MKVNSQIKLLLKIFVSLGLIVYLLYSQDIESIKENLSSYNPAFVVLALLSTFAGTYFSVLRWQCILQTSDYNVSVRPLYILYLKGYFYNNFLPTQMGGDVYKAVSLGNKIENHSAALFSVFMDRFGGLLVLLALGLFGIASIYGTSGLVIACVVTIAGLLAYFPVLDAAEKFVGHKIKLIGDFKRASRLFVNNKEKGLMVLGYSLIVQVFSFTSLWLIFKGFNVSLPLQDILAFGPIASLSLLIPSFNGLGTQETVYAFLFASAGVTAAISISASIVTHITRIILSLIGGILILFNINE